MKRCFGKKSYSIYYPMSFCVIYSGLEQFVSLSDSAVSEFEYCQNLIEDNE
jgi:hypothetical protein